MRPEAALFALSLCCLVTLSWAAAQRPATSTDELRGALYSLVHMFRDFGDKLERHEYRERQLGDQLKKALANLDKRHRTSDHTISNVSGALGRLEERLRTVEQSIMQRDERERIQLEKVSDSVDNMQTSMKEWQKTMEGLLSANNQVSDKGHLDTLEAGLNSRVDRVASTVERLEAHVLKMSEDKSMRTMAENLKVTSTNLLSSDAKWQHNLVETERVLARFEGRLAELHDSGSKAALGPEQDWHAIFLTALESHQEILKDLKQITEGAVSDLSQLPNRDEVHTMTNTTQEKLEEMRYELVSGTDKAVSKLDDKVNEAQVAIGRGQEEIMKAVTENGAMTEGLYGSVRGSYDQLLKEVQGLSAIEQVLVQTADNVLDTKRRIEYGVHQILLEVGELVKLQAKDLNTTVNRRFDNISATILDNQTGALTNLSSKIETEISQVWRQIGIMYQQLTASAGALDRLQMQTETYVNGSIQTMDSMEGKVSQITSRMQQVDSNLNYLLGRLSLFTQEFNQIKTGLGDALDNIRNSFLSVKEKIKDVGPGPNPIPDPEHEDSDSAFEVTAE